MGGAIGDALGTAFEGKTPEEVDFERATWQLSDDTQMTLATCEAIIERGGVVDPAAIAARFADWHRQSRISGIGASTYKALTELVAGGHWALVGAKGERAAGNGAAMRIAPLAFCLDPREPKSRQTLRDVARITHHNEEAYAGAVAVAIAVRSAFDGRWDGQNNLLELVIGFLPDTLVRDRLIAMNELPSSVSIRDLALRFGNSGFVAESVPLAICGANRYREIGFIRLLESLIACGGDSDTIASIAGQITGSLVGYSRLPAHLTWQVPDRIFVENLAIDFAESLKHL